LMGKFLCFALGEKKQSTLISVVLTKKFNR